MVDVNKTLESLLDTLATIEHERWAHWQAYVHSKGELRSDGSLVLPTELIERWERQIATPFSELTEQEKESDRDQVRRYLSVIIEALRDSS